MPDLRSLLAANADYVSRLIVGDLPAAPRHRLAILTCMDARIEPLRVLGLDLGDAHVIRNGGGRASEDVLRSLALGRALLGIELALVIHHTDCRLRGVDAPTLREALEAAGAAVPSALDLLPLPGDIAAGLHEDVARIRNSPLIPPGLTVHGLIYDVRTGRLNEIDSSCPSLQGD